MRKRVADLFPKLDIPFAEHDSICWLSAKGYVSHALSAFIHFATKRFKDC